MSEEWSDSENLFDLGILDSFALIEIVKLIENAIQVELDFDQIDIEDLFSIAGMRRVLLMGGGIACGE